MLGVGVSCHWRCVNIMYLMREYLEGGIMVSSMPYPWVITHLTTPRESGAVSGSVFRKSAWWSQWQWILKHTYSASRCRSACGWHWPRRQGPAIQWPKQLIHKRSNFACESNCSSGSKVKPMEIYGNKAIHLFLCYVKAQNFSLSISFNINFTTTQIQWIRFFACM